MAYVWPGPANLGEHVPHAVLLAVLVAIEVEHISYGNILVMATYYVVLVMATYHLGEHVPPAVLIAVLVADISYGNILVMASY